MASTTAPPSPHEPLAVGRAGPDALVLVGNPNVGKSVIFGLLTGRYVTVSNYPGTTVEVTRGYATHAGARVAVTDTPGINTLIPQSEDERVTRDILLAEDTPVVQIGDEKNLPRTLLLSLELAEAGRPFVLCLNMADEAESRGMSLDIALLSRRLGVDVLRTVATRREGTSRILPLAREARRSACPVTYDRRVEEAAAQVEPMLPEANISRRAMALMLLVGDETLTPWLRLRLSGDQVARIEEIRLALTRAFPRSLAFVINERRLRAAQALAAEVTRSQARATGRLADALSSATMHPVWGVPVLLAVLYVMYLFVGDFGAGTAVNFLESRVFGQDLASLRVAVSPEHPPRALPGPPGREMRLRLLDPPSGAPGGGPLMEVALERKTDAAARRRPGAWEPVPEAALQVFAGEGPGAFASTVSETAPGVYRVSLPAGATRIELHYWSGYVNPLAYRLFREHSPWSSLSDMVVGPYGLLTMGVTYAIAIVLPIVATFFFAFSILEDSGYLPRLAVMVNKVFRVMGLNGKAVLPMVLGLGCDTMATLTTRILETRKERLIVILLLALGVPCSAQLGVILGMLAALSWKAAALWSAVVCGVIVLVGFGASRLLPGRGSDFILEVPPLRVPALSNIVTKTMARMEWYLKEAVPLFIVGTLLLFVTDRTGILAVVEAAVSPLVTGVLGLPAEASEAFIIGFLRRDFGSAGLYRMAEGGLLDPIQVVVSLVTVTLFIPCIANFLMIVKERGTKAALLVAAFIFPFAILVGGALNFTLRALGVAL